MAEPITDIMDMRTVELTTPVGAAVMLVLPEVWPSLLAWVVACQAQLEQVEPGPSQLPRYRLHGRPHGGPPPLLTTRELEILGLVASGSNNPEIGRKLNLSEDTIKTHLRRLFQKLGACSRAHAVDIGHRMGLLSRGDTP